MIISAYMVPHPPIAVAEIGRGEEKKIQKTIDAYEEVGKRIAADHPDTIVITSPHALMYRDWFNVSSGSHAYGDFGRFRCPEVSFDETYDEEFVHVLNDLCQEEHFPAGTEYDRDHMLDHGTMVPLYFIEHHVHDFRLVRIGLSGLPLRAHYQLGMYLQKTAEVLNRRVVFVASGDLSHCQKEDGPYGFRKEGPVYDEKIMKTMGSGSFEELLDYDPDLLERAQECGHRSFCIMAGALDRTDVKAEALSHEATFGVGYGVVAYQLTGQDAKRNFLDQYDEKTRKEAEEKRKKQDPYVRLAVKAMNAWIERKEVIAVPEDVPEEMLAEQKGTFVSIHEYGQLRGCIGTLAPARKNVAEEIIHNAISACSRDPRFEAVRKEEIPYLEVSVDVLSEPEKIGRDASKLDVKKYGIICSTPDGRRGVLLPDLDGVDDVKTQIHIACNKGDIDEEDPEMEISRFEVVRHV